MAHTSSDLPPARHVPAHTNQGWPVAIAIIVLAVVVNVSVYLYHERTSSRHPIDPMFRAKGAAAPAHAEGATGPAGGEHGAPKAAH
jgi:hypothetical protein